MPKLTIIDGNSLLFRAYFATAYPGVEIMHNQDGIPTNAVFAFSNMINKIVNSLKEGEGIFVAFDAGKHNFRHDQLETYKANRKPAPEDLVKQFPIARDFLKAFGIKQFEEVGFEGDDIAGTTAKKAKEAGYDVVIYTSDRDFLQLVDDKISVNIIRKGLSDVVLMTPDSVKETFGIEPLQIIDYKGLRGDSSDNLPGIPGIGEKTAVKLINEYGSFDNIVANAENISGKVGEMIKANQEIGRISRDLAIIKTDIELPYDITDTTYEGYNFNDISEFCAKYGLKQFMNKIPAKWKKVDDVSFDYEIEKITTLAGITIGDSIGIDADFADRDDYYRSEIYGLGLFINKHCYYISIDDAKNDATFLKVFKDNAIKKCGYDYKAIKVGLAKYGIEVDGLDFDLLIASYLIDSTIKNNPEIVFGLYGANIATNNENNISLLSNENPEFTCKMACYSSKLKEKAINELKKTDTYNLFVTLEIPLVSTLANMEIEGFPLDGKMLSDLGKEYQLKIDQLTREIYELAGKEFVISSPKQLAEILYDVLKLPNNKKGATDVDTLKYLQPMHAIVGKVLEFRKYFKLLTTYVNGLLPHIASDGKIHASFNQAQTQTGRLSSSNPNLQNISVRDEETKMIRTAFYYPNENIEILTLDYSQIELRILSHLSDCKRLKEIFNSGLDIHSSTAQAIYGVDEVTSLQRRKAKVVNFGIVYGMSDWGLADELGISIKEAKETIDNFYKMFPEVGTFFQNIVDGAMKNGYVSTLLGRRRYLSGFHESNYQAREFAKRAAMNAPIQGSAADLIKLAMINIDKAIKEKGLKSKMVIQIHDELLFKVPKEEQEVLKDLVTREMVNAMHLSVPLEVDGGFGRSWYDAK